MPKNTKHTQEPPSNAVQVIQPHSTDFLELFQRLTAATPRDQNGFLTTLYDPTQIPHDFADRPTPQQQRILKAASLPLSMLEGYHSFVQPTQTTQTKKSKPANRLTQISHSPTPIWSRLPHEPETLYELFRHFLLTAERAIHSLQTPNHSAFSVYEAYILFYWKDRARSYDILKPVAAAKLREQRTLLAEDRHYQLSEGLLAALSDEIKFRADEQEGRPFAGLKAKEIVDSLVQAVSMQRISLGLPATGPANNKGYSPPPFAGTERSIRESSQNFHGLTDEGLTPLEQSKQQIDEALAQDPDAARRLQEAALSILMQARKNAKDAETGDSDSDS